MQFSTFSVQFMSLAKHILVLCFFPFLSSSSLLLIFPTFGSVPLYPDSAVSSLERGSPLPEGRSRSLRSSRPLASSSVTVVKMTPLSFLPGTRIVKYLGIINMFFIRETTSLREVGSPRHSFCCWLLILLVRLLNVLALVSSFRKVESVAFCILS